MALAIPSLRIPVFVSCPSALRPDQESSARMILEQLRLNRLQWRALGQPDYPRKLPLQEVIGMIKHCSGGVILGFEQYEGKGVKYRRGVKGKEKTLKGTTCFPTPWNHLEAGILFSLKLPILVFREPSIEGGVFDRGIVEDFTHTMPTRKMTQKAKDELGSLFQRWAGEVRAHYHVL
jgi:hypothetical protein